MRSEANFRLSECEPRRPVPPVTGQRAAQTHGGILRRGRQRNVPNPRVLPPRLLQGWERLSRHRRLVLVPGLLMFAPPPDGLALQTPGRYVGVEPQPDDGEPFAAKMKPLVESV